ncbi:conserved hypothetical protein [Trichinella spiralis]|uniref:hypothetical protein n=1 Tax=Trichinella spiralis TaxID=6334 RepID=UPI0001EFE0B2|nr:conserved hypothetical protein [Trichinella spiralis]
MNGHCLATIFFPLLLGASSFLYLTLSASSSLEERIQLNVTEGVPKNTVVGSITKLDGLSVPVKRTKCAFPLPH